MFILPNIEQLHAATGKATHALSFVDVHTMSHATVARLEL